jgi:probable F420-dependent oxidoreductase
MKVGIIKRSGTRHLPEIARLVEDAGFESLMLTEHTHVPLGSMSEAEAGRRAGLLDPFVALGAAAAVTSRLLLGTAVCVVTHREPLALAKAVSTLDLLSGGRVLFGVGMSSVSAENRSYLVSDQDRTAVVRERVAALKRLWSGEPAEYHGRFVDFEPVLSGPRPVQRPHPPILLGGGPARLADVLDWADGWLPHPMQSAPLRDAIALLGGKPVTIFNADPADLPRYTEAGVDRCLVDLRADEPDDVRAELIALKHDIVVALDV